jgi:hypothetical protein
LVIVQSREGNIFGSFAAPAWDSTSNWRSGPTELTFLFVLKNIFGDPPTQLPKKGANKAILCASQGGPTFGEDSGRENILGSCSYVPVQGRYVDQLGRGTGAFVSSDAGHWLSVGALEV